MRQFLLPVLLATTLSATLASQAQAQTASAPLVPASPVHYGMAQTDRTLSGDCSLALADGVTPNLWLRRLKVDGNSLRFADEVQALNYLFAQGWEIMQFIPEENPGDRHTYLLKRRTGQGQ